MTKAAWNGVNQAWYVNGVFDESYSTSNTKEIYKTDGTVEIYVNNALNNTSTWVLLENDSKIQLVWDGVTEVFTIETLTETQFSFSYTIVSSEKTEKMVMNYVH